MIERFLLDRIDAEARALSVCGEHHFSIAILTHETETAIARLEATRAWAEIAYHPPVVDFVPPPSE